MGSNDNMYLSEVSEGAKVGKQIWLQLHKKTGSGDPVRDQYKLVAVRQFSSKFLSLIYTALDAALEASDE